jgi:hypothetical protein
MRDAYNGMDKTVCSIGKGSAEMPIDPFSRIIEAAVVAGTIIPIFAIDHNWVKSFS